VRTSSAIGASVYLLAARPAFEGLKLVLQTVDRMWGAPGKSHGAAAGFAARQVIDAKMAWHCFYRHVRQQ